MDLKGLKYMQTYLNLQRKSMLGYENMFKIKETLALILPHLRLTTTILKTN